MLTKCQVPVDIVPYPFDTENDGSFMWTVPSVCTMSMS